jgi:ribosomal protein S18 acetylase RimI-like enzyme
MYVRHAPWQVYLHVLAGNTAAIGLYEKFGFTAESLIPHFYFFKGQWHDAYNMVYKYKE